MTNANLLVHIIKNLTLTNRASGISGPVFTNISHLINSDSLMADLTYRDKSWSLPLSKLFGNLLSPLVDYKGQINSFITYVMGKIRNKYYDLSSASTLDAEKVEEYTQRLNLAYLKLKIISRFFLVYNISTIAAELFAGNSSIFKNFLPFVLAQLCAPSGVAVIIAYALQNWFGISQIGVLFSSIIFTVMLEAAHFYAHRELTVRAATDPLTISDLIHLRIVDFISYFLSGGLFNLNLTAIFTAILSILLGWNQTPAQPNQPKSSGLSSLINLGSFAKMSAVTLFMPHVALMYLLLKLLLSYLQNPLTKAIIIKKIWDTVQDIADLIIFAPLDAIGLNYLKVIRFISKYNPFSLAIYCIFSSLKFISNTLISTNNTAYPHRVGIRFNSHCIFMCDISC